MLSAHTLTGAGPAMPGADSAADSAADPDTELVAESEALLSRVGGGGSVSMYCLYRMRRALRYFSRSSMMASSCMHMCMYTGECA